MKTAAANAANNRLAPVPSFAPVWAMPLVRMALVAMDAALAAGVFGLAFVLRQEQPLFDGAGGWSPQFAPYGALLWLIVPARVLTAAGKAAEAKAIWLKLAADPSGPMAPEARVRLGEMDGKPIS